MLYEALEARHLLTASIEGLVFGDTNQDGIQNNAETGIAGITVYADLNSNGARDGGEPFTQTTVDDPGTPDVDELGRYVIDNLSEQTHPVTIELSANTRQTAPLSPATGLTLRLFEDAIRPVQTSGSSPSDIQVSIDGQFVFVGWDQGRRITTFSRRVQDGQLTFQSELHGDSLYGIRRSVASPDGTFLYVPAEYSDAINVLQIDSSGTLSVVQSITISEDGNLDRVNALALAPDGSQLLATSTTTKSLLIYDIDSASGTLTLSQTFKEGVDGVTGLNFPAQPRVSPDGTLVAVATQASGNPLTLLDRDPVTGIVTAGGNSLSVGSNRDVIFSDDGRFLYVADFNGRLWTLTRDETSGDVQVQGSIDLGTKRLDKLVMRPDQAGIYATSSYTDSLLAFDRDPVSGAVTFNATLDPGDVPGISDAEGIAISPDGQHLYLASQRSNRIQTFWTGAAGQVAVANVAATVSGQTVTDINFAVSDASPRVTEFSTTSVSPESADSVAFTVVFDEAVTGVDVSDFQLFDSGLSQAAITSLSGGPTDYTVTVSTPSYAGNVQLQLVDDDTIVDVDSVPLGGSGTGAVAARTAPLQVDSLPPQVVAIASASDVTPMARELSFYVTFDESVSGVDVGDFQSIDGGGAVATVDAVVATGDTSVYRVDVSVSGSAGSIALRLVDDDTIIDVAANPLGDVGTAGGASGDGSFQSSAVVIDDARIVGRVRGDDNGDGLFDSDEFGQAGITVYADTNLNGMLDAGEPSAVTQSDDPGTSGIDESGIYELTSLTAGTTYSLRIDSSQHRQTTPVSYTVDDGTLTFADSVFGGVSTSDSLYSVDGITVTNDGKQLYAISPFGNKVSLLTRESVSDPFIYETSWSDVTPGFSGLASPTLLIFRPDERFGYLLAGNTIYVVQRDSLSGELSVTSTVDGATSDDSTFHRIFSASISPDGQYLYTAGVYSDTLSVYRIDATTGALEPIQELRQGVDGVQALDYPDRVQVSPDGAHVFVHSFFKAAMTIYSVTPGSGRLVESKVFASVPSAFDIAFSPDGNFAYSTSQSSTSDKIRVFHLDAGQWIQLPGTSVGLNNPRDLDISADGRFVYAADATADSVVVFSRDTQSGALTLLQTLNDVSPHDSLNGVEFIKLSPDGRELFAASSQDHSLTRFTRLSGAVTEQPHVITTPHRETSGVDFGIRSLFPSVTELIAAAAGATSEPTLTFTATFDEAVSGVGPDDFVIESTGISGAAIIEVTGGPTQYNVLVDTGSGDGTLQLRLVDDDSIVNAAQYPLGGVGADNGGVLSDPIAIQKSGSIEGRLVLDVDEDGYADLGEVGLAGATIFVDTNADGVLDPGEPFAVSIADDPATTGVDEAGTYRIQGVAPGDAVIVVIPPAGLELSNPATRAAPIGNTFFVRSIKDGSSGANYLDEAAGVTTSPDGNYLYVASYNDDSVTVFSRNAATGQLTVVQQVVDNVGGVSGLWGAQSIAITQDGENLYVASALDDALVMFDRDPLTGQLTFLGKLTDGIGGVDGLNEAVGVQVSDDGNHLYVAAFTDGSVTLFTRDPSTGLVSYTQKYVGNTSGAFAAEFSPDQRHVYVSAANSSAITVYDRDASSGLLTLKQTIRQSDVGVDGLSGVSGMSVSPDGKNVYAAGHFSDKIAVFDRDTTTGLLSFLHTTADPNGTSSARPISVLASPDGHQVVVMYELYDAIQIYDRDPSTGQLTLSQQFRDGFGGVDGLNGAWDAEFSNDGRFLHVVGAYDDAVVVFHRNAGPWVATTTETAVSTGTTTHLPAFAAFNVAPQGIAIDYDGSSPVTSDTIDVEISFSEPVVGFDADDLQLGGSLTSATVTDVAGSGSNYTATISLGAEQGTLVVTVVDDGSIDDAYGLDLGGPANGDGTFSSAVIDVDLLAPVVTSIENVFNAATSIRRLEFEVTFSEPVTQVDASDFQVVANGLSDVAIESVTGADDRYTVVVTNTAGTGTLALNLIDDDTIVDVVALPLGGTGLGNGDFAGAAQQVEPAQLTGRIFHDLDDDGYGDAAEPGIAGITVYLDENNNGIRDAGEPVAVTADDDPGTLGVDESGTYSITTEQTGAATLAIDLASSQYQQTSPRQFGGGTGFLTHQQTITTDPLAVTVFGNYGVEVSPDGNFVVLQVTDGGGGIAVFRQHPGGTLESLHWYPAGSLTDFGDPQSPTFSPTGEFLFLYSKQSKQVQTYGFDLSDGSLTQLQSLDLSAAIPGNFVSLDLQISPDGKNLYATSYSESTLRVFGVDSATGAVTLLQTFHDWAETPRLQNASGLTISPDGRHVYVGSFAEYYINAFDRDPADGTLTKIQELPDVRRPSRLLSSPDGEFIVVSAWDTFTGQDLITLRRDPETGLLSVHSRRVMPATPSGASLSPDGTSLHYADDDYADLNTLTRDPATGAFTALDVLTDDVDVPGMRGVDDTAVSPDGKYLYAVNGFERNLHRFTRDQGTRSIIPHLTSLGFGAQGTTFNFGIFNPPPTLVSATSNRDDPTTEFSATITIEFNEPVTGFDSDDLAFTAATLAEFPTAMIGPVSGGPSTYTVSLNGLAGSGLVELILNDDDTVVDSLGAPFGGTGTEALGLISFAVDNVAPSVQGWLPSAGTTTTEATLAFTVTFDEPVQGVGVDDFQLAAVGVTGASIIDVTGADDTYTINVNTGNGDGTLTVQLVDDDSITDLLAQPLGGLGAGNGDSASNPVTITKTGTIEGTLWHDFHENGVRDQAEGGVVGVTVYLDLNGNGQFDAATEPSVVTDADDPGTLQYDEAGRYQFFNVDPGEYSVRVDSAVWSASVETDWESVTSSTYTDQGNFGADNKSLRLSPDGRHLYVFDHLTDAIVVLAMPQSATESLTEVQVLADQFVDASNAAGDIAFTPDGAFMYVSEDQTERVAVYARNTSDGTLVRKQLIYVPDIGPYALEVSPDGKHLYVGGGYVAPYAIDPVEGTLTTLANTGTPARVQDLAFNSDGTKLYAVDYGNVLMRVYTRDPATGGITQIQATGSQTTPNLYSNWSVEIADNDRDVYVAAPLNDLVWHFHAAADGTLSYFSKLDLDHDGVRDLPMDLQLSPDEDILFAALGLDNAIQVLYRTPDGSLVEGPIYGTKDPSITNIYQNTSSLMAVSDTGDAVVRVNNRSQSIELYRADRTDAATVTVVSAAVAAADLGVTTPAPEVVSVTTSATSPWTGDSLQYEVSFNEGVTGVDTSDFQIVSSSISGATIGAVTGSGTTYTVTVDLSAAYGQGDLSIELIDDDSIRNDLDVPLLGYGVGSATVSPTITIELPAPTLNSLVFTNGTASEMQFTATFSQSVSGVDISDFDLEFVSGNLAGLSLAAVADGPTVYSVTVDLSSATGQGEFYLFLKDDDSIINGRSIPYEGVGVSSTTPRSDTIQLDFSNPSVTTITADPSPLLDNSDIRFEVTFSESVFNVDAADFSLLQSGVSGASILSVTGLPDGRTFQVLVDSGSLDGTMQLLLVDNDTISDGLGNPLGGQGLGNGDQASEIVTVERFPRRVLSGHIFFDTDGDGVRDPGERGVDAAGIYLDLDNDGQRDGNEPVGTASSDDPQTPGVDEGGFYRFGSLELGQYILRVRPDVRWIDDINNFTPVTLELSTTEAVADLGVTENLAAINGVVFDDLNQDGVLDAGEPGLAGWTLYIDDNDNDQLDAGERTTVTSDDDPQTPENETGQYSFSPLEFQSHRVQLVSRPEFFSTSPTSADRTIAGGTSVEIANFGTTANLTQISGAVFDDTDGDGIRSAGETGLADWTVFLDENQNGQWDTGEPTMQTLADDPATASIDEAGMFEFTTLRLGTHVVYASEPTNYLSTSPNPVSVSFSASTDTADVSFALVANDTALSGVVFDDVDRDGVRDAGEAGVSGARVYLDLNDSGSRDADEPSRFTAADGQYEFLHVVPGDHVVRADLPPLHEATSPAHDVTVALNQVITDLNFGARYLGYQITGTQFDDLNDNGVRDAGEPPLSGVTVFADLNNNGFPDSGEPQTTSGSGGDYVLTGTQPGTFTVRALSPEHYRPSNSYPSRDRLFGISNLHSQLPSPTGLVLSEFDPANGDVLGEFVVNQPVTTETELTFDGQNLVLVNSDSHTLTQLAFDGAEVRGFSLPRALTGAPYTIFSVSSPVLIGGFLFVVAGQTTDDMELWRTDLHPDGLGANYASAGDWELVGPITLATPGSAVSLRPASTTSTDGRSIVVGTTSSDPGSGAWLQIDPFTQTADWVSDFNTEDDERGMARIGDEVFVAYPDFFAPDQGEIQVYDGSGTFRRVLFGFPSQQGLAGGVYRDNGVVVTLAERESVADVNHAHHAELASISGNISKDLDVNGTIDAGEPAHQGVTVYVDLNQNRQFDVSEPSAITDAGGDYTISGLIPDQYTVRQVSPADHDGFAVADPISRLFTQATDAGVSTIYEIDVESGSVLNQFPSPGAVEAHAGMTIYDGDLYLAKSNQLFRIDPDSGEVLETIPTTPGLKDAIEIRDGVAYMTQLGGVGIEQFDLVRRHLIAQLDIHAINNLHGLGYVISTQGAAVDRESFVVNMRSGTYNVDFRTGLIIPHAPTHGFPWNAYLAAAAGESFDYATYGTSLRTIATTSTAAYNIPGAVTYRNIYSAIPGTVSDYGADVDLPAEHTVWATQGESVTGVDFGNQPAAGTISGVQFEDDNGNGIRDAGETPLDGVTVFIDQNANGFADPGEPQTVSAADGTYLFAGVPLGRHLIRAESPELYRPTNTSGVSDRLFGVTVVSNAESPTGNYLQIREINPITGDRIRTTDTTIPMTVAQTAAFDGKRLIVVDNNLDRLFEVGLDGTLLDQTPLPGLNGSTVFSQGPVVIDGTIYLMTVGGSMPMQLIRYDAEANTFYGAMPISRYIDPANELNGLPQFSLSLSESPDGRSILAFSYVDSRVFVIDPQTARMTTVINLPRTDDGDWSAGTVGGELFVRSSSIQGAVDVYDSQYNLVRTLANPGASGMGGGEYVDTGIVAAVTSTGATSGIDLGHQSDATVISGTVRDDWNQNRAVDGGEPTSVGVRVYLDSNRNGRFDSGEHETLTDASGAYAFTGLPPGDYTVRVDQPISLKVLTDTDGVELFTLEVAQGVSTIRKYDPITGQLLRQFPAPGASTTFAGLALDDSGLFYSADSTLWKLDPDDGTILDSLSLPSGEYGGLAVIDEIVYAVEARNETLYKIDVSTLQVIESIETNSVNQGPRAFLLQDNLGESADGTNLLTRLDNGDGTLLIHPETAVFIDYLPTNQGTVGLSGVGGEIFRASNDQIRVESYWEGLIRDLETVQSPYGIGAALVPSSEYTVRAAPGVDHPGLDFFQQVEVTSIQGVLWDDLNADGVMDPAENRLAGRTVFLDDNHNGVLDSDEPFVVTMADDPATTGIDETGRYRFGDLVPGAYDVTQVLPEGWRPTFPFADAFDVGHLVANGYVAGVNSGTNPYYDSSISDDGAFIAFSTDNALLPEDTHPGSDIYVIDSSTGQLEMITVSSEEVVGNARSLHPLISADGRFVVFWSYATNFVANDNNNTQDIFVRDRLLGTTTLVSAADPNLATGSSTGNSYSYSPGFSDDGRYVTFWSDATDLVPGDTNGVFDLFLRDLQLGTTERINLAPDGSQAIGGNTHNSHPSADGRFIAYWSWADNLVADDTNGVSDAFVLDRQTGITERVSVTAAGVQSDANVHNVSISDDGRYVVFHSGATTLSNGPGVVGTQVYLKDRLTGELRMIGRDQDGIAPNQSSVMPLISGDGRWVVFSSWASNLDEDDPDGGSDAFLYDVNRDTVTLLSRSLAGGSGNGRSDWVRISNDGSTITFNSVADNLTSAPPSGGNLYSVNINDVTNATLVQTVSVASGQAVAGIDFGSIYDPIAPSDIVLSGTSIVENLDTSASDTPIATLSTVDSDTPTGHSYELVSGIDDADNTRFTVVGNQLLLKQGETVDYEAQDTYRVRLKVTDTTGMTFEKAVVLDVVDALELSPIDLDEGSAQRSSLTSLSIAFDGQVDVDPGAFSIRHRDSDGMVDFVVSLDHSGGQTTATFTFTGAYTETGGSLVDGNYQLTIDGDKIRSAGGGANFDADGNGTPGGLYHFGEEAADRFFRLFGDSDGDRDVDGQDYGRFGMSFLKREGQPGFDDAFDSDGDGDVDGQDYARFGQRFLRSLPFE
ncbi:beta-propeller fold lactonase family protein [Rhodopirellula sp. JC639]|uniref:beta-propeller fold lactonase family protein n=1 Tax=Stieleria mannarensis TaxID=2755585 RepID=UPI0016023AE1|nr:beta-propeller fold lactonase family protein [Rhodopirellula sp. JC639]